MSKVKPFEESEPSEEAENSQRNLIETGALSSQDPNAVEENAAFATASIDYKELKSTVER